LSTDPEKSMPSLSFVTVCSEQASDLALQAIVQVDVLAHVDHLDDLAEAVADARPNALLVGLHENPREVFDALEKLLAPKPLLFFHGPDDSQLILQAMRFGAREYIAPGSDAENQLRAAVDRVAGEVTESSPPQQASLIALIGAKGGVGTSFLACQLGASLARMGGRTALVDGHMRHGDVALYLDLAPQYTISSLAMRSEPVDSTYMRTALAPHSSGVQVLAAPKRPEEADGVSVSCVEGVVSLLRSEFDWLVWDTPQDFDDRSLFILDQADSILLITTPDVPAMNHTRMQLELLERLGRSGGEIRIVLNRTERKASVSARDAKEFLDRPVDASIPNDYRRASACVNEGRTLHDVAPRSPLGQALGELALLNYSWSHRAAPRQRSLLDRLRGN
jgi:pilus assembly protein CpaE